jgi:RNA polymerase sigma factor (sigma-70 family)
MAASAESLLGHLHHWLSSASAEVVSDAVLLERFARRGDGSAFAALLARHGPMVQGVCRRVLHDRHEAEDAFQATFLVLARKAGMLHRPHALAAWLYGTARHLALKRRRGDARRHRRETDYAGPAASPRDPLDELAARELLLILDEEMERLPESYRLPLLLCGVQGRPQEEAARLLGCTPAALRGRLERGRKRLHARLSRRGLAFSGALPALNAAQGGPADLSPGLTSATLQAAQSLARGERGGIATTVLALAEGGARSMGMTPATLGMILLVLVSLAVGAGILTHPRRGDKQSEAQPEARLDLPAPEATVGERSDRFGDPLPAGALTRLGSIRLRHGGHVMAVAFTPDGKSVVSGGYDGWSFQWDVHSGKRQRGFRGGAIHSLALDPQGKRLALPDWSGGKLRLYERATGKELACCPGHPGGTWMVVFSPDGQRLASGGKDRRIRVWDAATLKEVGAWEAAKDEVYRLRFSPDGKSLASLSSSPGALRLWDATTGAERPLRGPLVRLQVTDFCFTAEGKGLLTASDAVPAVLQLWDFPTGKEVRTITRVRGPIAQIALAPDGKSVWSAAWNDLRQWDLATGKQLLHLPHPLYVRQIEDIALSPDGKRLATGTYSHDVFLWDATTGRQLLDPAGHHNLNTAAFFTPDGRQLWTGGFDQTVRLWSAASGEQLRCLCMDDELVYSHALRPDGKMLAAGVVHRRFTPGNPSGVIRLWDLTTGKQRQSLSGHAGLPLAVAFSPDGRLFASRGEDNTIRLWDVAAGKERWLQPCQESGGKGIGFTADGLHVISGLDKETVGFWEVTGGRVVRRLSTGPCGGERIPFLSRDGRMLVCGGGEQPLLLWEVASAKKRCRIDRPGARGFVVAALSPNSRILAWFDFGQPIKLWDLIASKQLGELGDQTTGAAVLSLTFSPDSRRLVSTYSDGTALIWDVARLSLPAATPPRLPAPRLEQLWNELADEDAARAYGAVRTLVGSPGQAVCLLRERLPKSASTDVAKLTRLLADLDSDQFEVRQRASRGLQELGMLAGPAMRRTLGNEPSLEARRRLEKILEKLDSAERTDEELRLVRAVEVLELIGSAEARQVLREQARGPADAWLTQEAGAALARLAARGSLTP